MLGLDVGGSCHGIAYRVAEPEKAAVADYLYRRELVTDGYQALLHLVPILNIWRPLFNNYNRWAFPIGPCAKSTIWLGT